MADRHIPHYFQLFPTGKIPVPVCIGDLPSFDYKVDVHTPTEEVSKHLRQHVNLPGVMLVQDGRLMGAIPRLKMFERIGQRYGIELFFQKPISLLYNDIHASMHILPAHMRVEEAIRSGLSRPTDNLYDPIIMLFEDGGFRMLDMYALLLAQSETLAKLNGVMSSLNNIERAIYRNVGQDEAIEMIMDSLKQVVPHHHASVLLKRKQGDRQEVGNLMIYPNTENVIDENITYKTVLRMRQPICVEDVSLLTHWRGFNGDGKARAWMGVPLIDDDGTLGLLSLSRYSASSYTSHEKESALTFAKYLAPVLGKTVRERREIRPRRKSKPAPEKLVIPGPDHSPGEGHGR